MLNMQCRSTINVCFLSDINFKQLRERASLDSQYIRALFVPELAFNVTGEVPGGRISDAATVGSLNLMWQKF